MPLLPQQQRAIDLGRTQQVQIHDMRILIPSAVNFMKGGCDRDGCVARVEVVDIAHGTLYMVPIGLVALRALSDQLKDVIRKVDGLEQGEM